MSIKVVPYAVPQAGTKCSYYESSTNVMTSVQSIVEMVQKLPELSRTTEKGTFMNR